MERRKAGQGVAAGVGLLRPPSARTSRFYDGLPQSAKDRCKRTRHAWAFKLSDKEKWDLASTKDRIATQTKRDDPTMIRQFEKTQDKPGGFASGAGRRLLLSPRDEAETSRLAAQLQSRTGGGRLQIPDRKPGT